jgi:ubiquinone/menaquinone biosynthesis C-methylase UbiE
VTTDERAGDGYVLGHSARELDRLDLQGSLYREPTLRVLERAGIGPGMRVLDVGCGSGDVSMLAAARVGPTGHVLGVDLDEATVSAARERVASRGITNVAFDRADFAHGSAPGGFDAVIGRFILMHQADPSSALAAAAGRVRPGGAVAFVESSMTLLQQGIHSHPHSPLYDRVIRWKCAVVGGAGAHLDAGMALRATFVGAGLPEPETSLQATVVGGAGHPYYRYIAESVGSMLAMADRLGVEGFDRAGADALASELDAEVSASGGVLVAWPVVTAWCRLPGA